MNLFELFVKIGVDDQASGQIDTITSKLGGGLETAAKIGVAAVSAAAAGITALTTQAVNSYAEYEQLIGGAELLFGDAFSYISDKASEAYKNVQMSQNEYLQQVNGFAVGLKTALGDNEQAAAELADRIIQAQADIVAATGNAQENVQNAFNGIMKSNFTMLDNLQIGITPTKEGFQSLIDKVNEWNASNGKFTEYTIDNVADCQSALIDYIEMQGLSGYASAEAAETIAGSVASMKAAWEDFLTALGDQSADYGEKVTALLETVETVASNVYPIAENVLFSVADLIDQKLPEILDSIPQKINDTLPSIIAVAGNLVKTFVQSIAENHDLVIKSAFDIIIIMCDSFVSMLPDIIALGFDLIISLALGITDSLPQLIPSIIDVVLKIVEVLTSPEQLAELLDAALVLIISLAEGIMGAIPQLNDAVFQIIENLIVFLLDPENISKIINAAVQLVITLGNGLINGILNLRTATKNLIKTITETFKNTDWLSLGKDIVDSLLSGLQTAWSGLTSWFSDGIDSLVGGVKDLLGIHSPSRVFADIGKNMALGVGEGWEDTFDKVADDIDGSMDFDYDMANITGTKTISGSVKGAVSVIQNIYASKMTPSEVMNEAIYNQKKAVLFGV